MTVKIAETQMPLVIGVQSVGVWKRPCQASSWSTACSAGRSRDGRARRAPPGRVHRRPFRRSLRRCCCVTTERKITEGRDGDQRQREHADAATASPSAWRRRDAGAGEIGDRVEAPGDQPADSPAEESGEQRQDVGERSQCLSGEDLAPPQRAGEDHLQRAARVLGGDDVAGDERGDELGAEAGGEVEDDEREDDPVWRRLWPSGASYGPPFWNAITDTNSTGSSAAAPIPMYVRFWERSLRTSQR